MPASRLISLFSLAYFYVSGFFENIDDTFMFSAFSIVRRVGFSVCVCIYVYAQRIFQHTVISATVTFFNLCCDVLVR